MNSSSAFLLRDWRVEPDRNRLVGPDGYVHLPPRTMAVLVFLVDHAGEVVSRDEFSEQVWAPAVVSDDALTGCISELRRAFGDSTSSPSFIETIPKRGYRLVAPVEPVEPAGSTGQPSQPTLSSDRLVNSFHYMVVPVAVVAVLIVAAAWWWTAAENGQEIVDAPLNRIAVMPFRTIGGEPTVPLAEGMHFDLLSRLSGYSSLRVISSSAVARYKDTNWTVVEVARDLNVDWILDGTVQQEGDRIQVNAQLIDTASESNRWARTYRRDLSVGDLFALQGEVIEDIARSLASQFDSPPQNDPALAPTQNLEAYTLFTQARTMLVRRSAVDMWRAVELFEAAIELDPDYAPALAALADTQVLLAYYEYGARDDLIAQARANALRSLDIDPALARGYVVLGVTRLIGDRDGPGALEALERAYALDNGFSGWLGYVQAVLGKLEPAIENAEATLRIVPHAPGAEYTLAKLILGAGELQRALDLIQSARKRSPAYVRAHLLEGQIRLAMEQPGLAVEAMERAIDHLSGDPNIELSTWVAIARLRAGQPVDLAGLERRLETEQAAFERGLLHWALGDLEAALQMMMQSDWTDNQTLQVRYYPLLDDLRFHPGFSELLASLNQAWQMPADTNL